MASDNVDLPDLSHEGAGAPAALLNMDGAPEAAQKRSAQDLEAVFDGWLPKIVGKIFGF